MRKYLYFSLGAIVSIALCFAPLLNNFGITSPPTIMEKLGETFQSGNNTFTSQSGAVSSTAAYADLASQTGLPIASVSVHTVPDASGTVILIPQDHRYPGSAVSDPANDDAETAQQQIYQIMSYLNDQGINLIMVEGDLAGAVPDAKIEPVREELSARSAFATETAAISDELKNSQANAGLADSFSSDASQVLAALDRTIILAGAPYKLKAEGKNVDLVGAENADTLAECTTIVRNYIYQQDRLAQLDDSSSAVAQSQSAGASLGSSLLERLQQLKNALTGGSLADLQNQLSQTLSQSTGSSSGSSVLGNDLSLSGSALTGNGASSLTRIYQALLSRLGSQSGTFTNDLSQLTVYATDNGNTTLADNVAAAQKTYSTIVNLEQAPATVTTATTNADGQSVPVTASSTPPSRADNPYEAITDPSKIQSLLNQSEQQIQSVVVDQRNQEAAANFSRALAESHAGTGMLVFGAGHEDGLVQELNKQGLSVVVITPTEVADTMQTGQ